MMQLEVLGKNETYVWIVSQQHLNIFKGTEYQVGQYPAYQVYCLSVLLRLNNRDLLKVVMPWIYFMIRNCTEVRY